MTMYDNMVDVRVGWIFLFKKKTAYESSACLVGTEIYIRDSSWLPQKKRGVGGNQGQARQPWIIAVTSDTSLALNGAFAATVRIRR